MKENVSNSPSRTRRFVGWIYAELATGKFVFQANYQKDGRKNFPTQKFTLDSAQEAIDKADDYFDAECKLELVMGALGYRILDPGLPTTDEYYIAGGSGPETNDG